jgi:hypothetical protein
MDLGTGHRIGKLSEDQRQQVNLQLESYFQNSAVSMSKDQYFEMCEMLGNEPNESEIPVEYDDLPLEVQDALRIYNTLQDNWDYMGGNYIGKNLAGFKDILEIYEVDKADYRSIYEMILNIDRIRGKQIADSKPKK